MADSDLPTPGTAEDTPPQSFDDAVEDISDLLGDPATPDLKETETEPNAAEENPDDPDYFPDAEDAEDPDGTDDPDNPDGPEVKGGRFAPDNAKLKLDNGETITVRELKDRVDARVKDFQRDYTSKTERLKAVESEVGQYAQELNQARDFHAWFAETYMPQPPEPFKGSAAQDPAGYAIWRQQKDAYDTFVGSYQQMQQQRQQETQQEAQQREQRNRAALQTELQKLTAAYPLLKDDAKRAKFWEQTYGGADEYYGLTRDEVQSIPDHRVIKVLRDAIAYRRLKATAPAAKDEAARRPAMQQGGKRNDPRAQQARTRQAKLERLRSTGSFEDGVASLADFEL